MGRFEQRASAPSHHLTFCNNTELWLASNSHWSPYSLFRFVTNVQSLSVSICATCVDHWRGSGTFWIAGVSWLANTVVNYAFSVYNLRQRWIGHLSGGRLKGGGGSHNIIITPALDPLTFHCSSSMDPDAGPPPSSIFRSSRWRERPSDLAFKPCWNISDYQTNVKTINKGLLGYGIEIVHVMHTETR